ncbi:MAG: hypothetical protein QM831_15740 [Kofleriaceae bacterium]
MAPAARTPLDEEPIPAELMAEIRRRVDNIGKSPGFTREEAMARAMAVIAKVRARKRSQ